MKLLVIAFIFSYSAYSQTKTTDTTRSKLLNDVIVQGYKNNESSIKQLPDIHQNFIVAGKKNEVISVQNLDANISEKTGRQIFAKIAGAFVYDMDGSGNQLNVSTRGLDPHRSW